jgi:hypothetical protein
MLIPRKRSFRPQVIFTTGIVAVALLSLNGCSPGDAKAQRKQKLQEFCTSVSQHLLDRDPNSIRDSLNILLHEELSDGARQKLEDNKTIPDSPITVLKWTEEWKTGHKANKVEVTSVTPLGPVDAKDVKFRVNGIDHDLVSSKEVGSKPFLIEMTCELTPDMDGFPRVLELQVLSKPTSIADAAKPITVTSVKAQKRKKHH